MSGRNRQCGLSLAVVALSCVLAAGAAAQTVPWAMRDAPVRAVVKLKEAPKDPDAGVEIVVPDFGLVRPRGGNYMLTDTAGKPVPLAVVWQGEGRDTLLLARGLQAGQSYDLYIGGSLVTAWTPKTSLLWETRGYPATRREAYTSLGALEAAWDGAAAQSQGARFVERIFEGDNPFGESSFFLSHFSGYLAPTDGDVELFTNSTDASFVLINDQPFIDWTGPPSGNATEKGLHARRLPVSAVPVKVDYYQAKGGGGEPPNMSLGWRRPGGHLEPVPETAFLHAGKAHVSRFESRTGAPVPAPEIALKSYLGYGGAYLYEVTGKLAPADLNGAAVEWRFDDGAVLTGPEFARVMAAVPGTQSVTVTARRGTDAMQTTRRVGFFGKPPREASEGNEEGESGKNGHERYVNLLAQLDPAKLAPPMLAAALPLLLDSGTDAQAAAYATPWLAKADLHDPLWLPAYVARVRAIAQTDPKAALAEIKGNFAAQSAYPKQLNGLEIELLVFALHDLANLPRVQQLAFNLGPDAGQLGNIRLGDLYRLNGQVDQAVARYRAAQPPDPSNGRRLPAEDEANSMTVEDLLVHGTRQDALDRLTAWELAHPMCKFSTNFLVLRARVLSLYGRWRESLAELDAYAATHPDSPYQIDVDYYRARALRELGNKDEARKIWRDLAKNYPKSELAQPSLEWAAKP